MRYLLIYFLFCHGSIVLFAQEGPPPIRIGVGMMGITYAGDLTVDEGSFQRFSPGGHLAVQFANNKNLRPALIAGYGGFREQIDIFPKPIPQGVEPNKFVETNFFFADFRLQYYFFSQKQLSPFIAAGVGMFSFSPRDQGGNFLAENIFTRLDDEFYNTTIASFPITLGFNLKVNQVIALSLGYTQRFTPTDYLDNIGLLGTKAGNDAVQHFQMGVHFTLVPKEQIALPPPPDDPDRPLDIVAFQPEADRRQAFRVPERLNAETPNDQTALIHLEQMIAEDLKRVHLESQNEQNSSDLTQWQKQEQAAITANRFVYYAVKPTDQLGDIAKRFKSSPQSLRTLNQLEGNDISNRVFLRIPDVSRQIDEPVETHKPVSDSVALDSNMLDNAYWLTLEEAALSEERYRFVFVTKDQSLDFIAKQYHIRLETILKLNYMQDAGLKADTYLRIPDLGAY